MPGRSVNLWFLNDTTLAGCSWGNFNIEAWWNKHKPFEIFELAYVHNSLFMCFRHTTHLFNGIATPSSSEKRHSDAHQQQNFIVVFEKSSNTSLTLEGQSHLVTTVSRVMGLQENYQRLSISIRGLVHSQPSNQIWQWKMLLEDIKLQTRDNF